MSEFEKQRGPIGNFLEGFKVVNEATCHRASETARKIAEKVMVELDTRRANPDVNEEIHRWQEAYVEALENPDRPNVLPLKNLLLTLGIESVRELEVRRKEIGEGAYEEQGMVAEGILVVAASLGVTLPEGKK